MKPLLIKCLLPTEFTLRHSTSLSNPNSQIIVDNALPNIKQASIFTHPDFWFLLSMCIVLSILYIRAHLRGKKLQIRSDKEETDNSQNIFLLKTVQLIEKDELVKEMYTQINRLLNFSGIPDETKMALVSLKNSMKHGLVNNAWADFELIFEKVHPDFFKNLNANYPSLTNNERKLCALILLNLGTREISDISRKSVRSVEVAKYRLSKKMDLNDGKLLYQELMKLS